MGKMRARIAPTKVDVQRANERCWQTICETQAISNSEMMIAVKRHFRLGPKRMAELAKTMEEVQKEFKEYEKDGRLIQKITEELMDVDIDISEAWNFQTFEELKEECRKQKKTVVDVSEARGIREMFNGFKWLMEHQNG